MQYFKKFKSFANLVNMNKNNILDNWNYKYCNWLHYRNHSKLKLSL